MKWKGQDIKVTPTLPRFDVATYLENARLAVDGEMRWRRGMAKSSVAVQSGAILGGAATNTQFGPFTILQVGTTLEGFPNGAAQWGDVQLQPPGLSALLDSGLWTATVTRTTQYATEMHVSAAVDFSTGPVYDIGVFPIGPAESSIEVDWTAPSGGTYYFIATEKRGSLESLPAAAKGGVVQPPCVGCASSYTGTATVSGATGGGICAGYNDTYTGFSYSVDGSGNCVWTASVGDYSLGITYDPIALTWLVGLGFMGFPPDYEGYVTGLSCVDGVLSGTVTVPNTGGACGSSVTIVF